MNEIAAYKSNKISNLEEIKASNISLNLVKDTYCKDATNEEFALFMAVADSKGLSIINKQIYSIPRKSRDKVTRTIQVSIDGFRLIAYRTGRLLGISDAIIKEEKGKIISATVTVKMLVSGMAAEFTATAYYDEYCQKYNGQPTGLWEKLPRAMLSKCAEALALRKAAPEELSGLYTSEEMSQSDTCDPAITLNVPNCKPSVEDIIELDVFVESELYNIARQEASLGTASFRSWFKSLAKDQKELLKKNMDEYQKLAVEADKTYAN